MKIAFAGNPNSGKTTMFNALTGKNEKVGNWAGVTVDKKEAPIKKAYSQGQELIAVDLPGAYSMTPFTAEESVTSGYIRKEAPDVIVNIVDATNLSRSLFFTTQLLELGIPMVVALNKSDLTEKKQTAIDTAALSKILGCPVVETVSTSAEGLVLVVAAALSRLGKPQTAPFRQELRALRDRQAAQVADRKRFAFVSGIITQVESRKVRSADRNFQDRIDDVLTHPVIGLPIFAAIMFLVFQISQAWLGVWIAEGVTLGSVTLPGLVTLIDTFKDWVTGLLVGGNDFLVALLTEGIIGGFAAVVGFLPLVMVMYFLLALLEDCGYMARATVVLDPIFKRVGLSGKSVIPFVVGTGCAIPGIMAARTIRDPRERNAAAMLTPFMPCGAKLPVIALFAGAFFEDAPWVGTLMYFAGIFFILLGALLIGKLAGLKKRTAFFIMELPEYKLPSLKRAFVSMCSRGWAYIVKAGTVILLCNAAVFVMQSFDWRFQPVGDGMEHTSILASIAGPVAVLLVPVAGIAAWQLAAGFITGFIAKENVVGTLAVCYGFAVNENLEILSSGNEVAAAMVGMTKAAALGYLMLNLFSPPCVAALGAMNAEIDEKKWFWGGIALQLGTGYSAGFLVYQLGTLLTTGAPGAGFSGGLCFLLALAGVVISLCARAGKRSKTPIGG